MLGFFTLYFFKNTTPSKYLTSIIGVKGDLFPFSKIEVRILVLNNLEGLGMDFLHITENTLRRLQPFHAVAAMNEAVRGHKRRLKLGKRDREILDVLSRFACVYIGVCYLNKQSIAEEAGYNSRRTAIRACHHLEDLGVIKQYVTRRVTGDRRQSVNIIVIQPVVCPMEEALEGVGDAPPSGDRESSYFHEESLEEVTVASHTKEAFPKTLLKTNTYKETSTETEKCLKRGLKTAIPETIFNAFSPFFDAQTLYDMYGVLLRAKRKATFMIEDYAERYVDHFYNVIRLYKWGRVRNLKGYLYVTWEKLTSEISRKRNGKYRAIFEAFEDVGRGTIEYM